MTPADLNRAAEILEQNAEMLLSSFTLDGRNRWAREDSEIKREHDDSVRLARGLRALESVRRLSLEEAAKVCLDFSHETQWAGQTEGASECYRRIQRLAKQPAPIDAPDFWTWLDRAYRNGSEGDERKFTKWNMQVAYAAGRASIGEIK